MMLLISMAITVAYAASMATSFDWLDLEFWWELAALVTIMLLGHWQEMKAIGQARGALAALAELLPDDAEIVDGDDVRQVPVDELRVGDVVLVRAGGRVPADGEIVEGEAELDESMITGESKPVAKGPGDRVVAGTVSTDSSIRVRVDAVGDDTALAGIQRLVADAQASHSRAQALADRFAALLFYVAVAAAIVTFIAWSALGDVDEAIIRTVTVLVIACPHALGLAIPLVIAMSTAVAAKAGILVKDRLALERMRTDRHGAVRQDRHADQGRPRRHRRRRRRDGLDEAEVLRLAGGRRVRQRAPAGPGHRHRRRRARRRARGRAASGRSPGAASRRPSTASATPSAARRCCANATSTCPTSSRRRSSGGSERGAAVLYLVRDDEVIGAFALEDEVRPEAARGRRRPAADGRRGGDDHR